MLAVPKGLSSRPFSTHVHCIGRDILWLTCNMSIVLVIPWNIFMLVLKTPKPCSSKNLLLYLNKNLRHENSWYVSSLEGEDVRVQQSALWLCNCTFSYKEWADQTRENTCTIRVSWCLYSLVLATWVWKWRLDNKLLGNVPFKLRLYTMCQNISLGVRC